MSRDIENNKESAIYLFALMAIPIRLFGYISYFISRMIFFPQMAMFLLYSKFITRERLYKGRRHVKLEIVLVLLSVIFFIVKYVVRNEHGAFPYIFWWYNK